MTANIPRPFTGTPEELAANIATHDWYTWDGETRCDTCDCRRYGRSAMWPCGQEQRTTTTDHDAALSALADLLVGIAVEGLSRMEADHEAN